jgi:hypothetical protein
MKPFSAFGSFLFALIAVAHLVRVIFGWTLTVGAIEIPMWPSVAVFLGLGFLAWAMCREACASWAGWQPMTDSHRYGTWALWTLVTALGYSLGLYAGFFLAHFLLGRLMAALAIGGAVGLAQRPVLQGFLEPRRSRTWSPAESATWIFGSMGGMAAVFGVGWILVQMTAIEDGGPGLLSALFLALALAIGGGIAGVIQVRVLRRYLLDAQVWIAASATGWAGSGLGLVLIPVLEERMYDLFVILLAPAVGGAVLGLTTGYVLVRLRRRQPPAALPGGPW